MGGSNTQAPPPKLNKVSAIDFILSSTGAVQGFPTIAGVDLNAPGWINDTTTTFACRLVFQVKFTLSGIPASDVALARRIVRVATVMNKDGTQQQVTKTAPDGGPTGDGPTTSPVSTVVRPSTSLIAVSDDPGYPGGNTWNFPMTYHASFDLYAFDVVTKAILAKTSYVIDIQKQTSNDSSPTTNLSSIVKTIN